MLTNTGCVKTIKIKLHFDYCTSPGPGLKACFQDMDANTMVIRVAPTIIALTSLSGYYRPVTSTEMTGTNRV